MRGLRRKYSPFSWSKRTIKVILTAFYMVTVPVFVYFGLQPAEAANQEVVAELVIPSISLSTPVVASELAGRQLSVPDRIVSAYSENTTKTLLMGHSSTIFKDLTKVNLGDEITYQDSTYVISNISTQPKQKINMANILSEANQKTVILMTCAGFPLGHDDYTDRLIITAEKVSDNI